MIAFLDGVLVEKHPTRVVLDVQGVGYDVFIPLSSYDRLPESGARCRVLTYLQVREDAHVLFGFLTDTERRMFGLLMTVSGIGPKLALSALSGLSVRELKAAIVGGDSKRLSGVSGVGRKTSDVVIVELKDKFSAGEALEALAGPAETDMTLRDAIAALVSLGYKQEEARKLVVAARQMLPDAGVEVLIKKALST
ncbi:MAG: Holliday junction branch migration protein RuvA [Verrucomicrobia bacterium]|nr:Holliday junction branch migration protein RuvA [Verrucomicrobiota bacterium]